jgi:hypothetical protein
VISRLCGVSGQSHTLISSDKKFFYVSLLGEGLVGGLELVVLLESELRPHVCCISS